MEAKLIRKIVIAKLKSNGFIINASFLTRERADRIEVAYISTHRFTPTILLDVGIYFKDLGDLEIEPWPVRWDIAIRTTDLLRLSWIKRESYPTITKERLSSSVETSRDDIHKYIDEVDVAFFGAFPVNAANIVDLRELAPDYPMFPRVSNRVSRLLAELSG